MTSTRITCPECGAVYEVPLTAIPSGGRDVKCAACGHDWYQLWTGPAGFANAVDEDLPARFASRRSAAIEPVPGFAERPQPPLHAMSDLTAPFGAQRMMAYAGFGPDQFVSYDDEEEDADEPADDPELDLPPPPKRHIDPDVLAVLKSEAEVETQARRRDASVPLESQGELPLVILPKRSASEVRERLARLQAAERSGEAERWTASGDTPNDPPDVEAPRAKGFRPLPPMADLPPPPKPARPAPPEPRPVIPAQVPAVGAADRSLPVTMTPKELALYREEQHRKGFRIGFFAPLIAAGLVLAVYLGAPLLIERLPQAAPLLSRLIEHGDQVQTNLANRILDAFDRLGSDG